MKREGKSFLPWQGGDDHPLLSRKREKRLGYKLGEEGRKSTSSFISTQEKKGKRKGKEGRKRCFLPPDQKKGKLSLRKLKGEEGTNRQRRRRKKGPSQRRGRRKRRPSPRIINFQGGGKESGVAVYF